MGVKKVATLALPGPLHCYFSFFVQDIYVLIEPRTFPRYSHVAITTDPKVVHIKFKQ